MEFKDGTTVYSMEKKEAGNLQRVVIDPDTKQVTHIVIQKGLFKEDKVVPVEKVTKASEEEVELTCTLDELKELPPLEVTQIVSKDESAFYDRSPGETYVPAGAISETLRTIPDHLVALKEGAKVISSDEKHVGNIERMFTDSGKLTHFTISQGFLVKTEKSIPFEWVEMFAEDELDLNVESERIDSLPPVQK